MKIKLAILVCLLVAIAVVQVLAAASVTLAWDHSPDITNYPNSIFYRIYHQTNVPPSTNFVAINSDTHDVGTNTTFTHTNLNMVLPHVWAVTAVGTTNGPYSGLESEFSNWVQFGPITPVAQVTNVRMRP